VLGQHFPVLRGQRLRSARRCVEHLLYGGNRRVFGRRRRRPEVEPGGHGPRVGRSHQQTHAHQRKAICVKHSGRCRVRRLSLHSEWGWCPAACNRVVQTTGGAAHDERRGARRSSMPRRARPDRQLVQSPPKRTVVRVRRPW
jgi:hypothetical protein